MLQLRNSHGSVVKVTDLDPANFGSAVTAMSHWWRRLEGYAMESKLLLSTSESSFEVILLKLFW